MNNCSFICTGMPRVKDDTKIEIIYNATLELVLETGYTAMKMADVAEKAGMATGTMYIYFKNKEELVNQLYIKLKTEKISEMMRGYNTADSFFVSFRKLWHGYFKSCISKPHRMIFLEQYLRSPYLSAATKKKAEDMLKPLEQFLEAGQKQQIIKDYPPQVMINHMVGAVNEIVKYYFDNNKKPSKQVVENCFSMAWNSVRN